MMKFFLLTVQYTMWAVWVYLWWRFCRVFDGIDKPKITALRDLLAPFVTVVFFLGVQGAIDRTETMTWRRAGIDQNSSGYKDYLRRFPQGGNASIAGEEFKKHSIQEGHVKKRLLSLLAAQSKINSLSGQILQAFPEDTPYDFVQMQIALRGANIGSRFYEDSIKLKEKIHDCLKNFLTRFGVRERSESNPSGPPYLFTTILLTYSIEEGGQYRVEKSSRQITGMLIRVETKLFLSGKYEAVWSNLFTGSAGENLRVQRGAEREMIRDASIGGVIHQLEDSLFVPELH